MKSPSLLWEQATRCRPKTEQGHHRPLSLLEFEMFLKEVRIRLAGLPEHRWSPVKIPKELLDGDGHLQLWQAWQQQAQLIHHRIGTMTTMTIVQLKVYVPVHRFNECQVQEDINSARRCRRTLFYTFVSSAVKIGILFLIHWQRPILDPDRVRFLDLNHHQISCVFPWTSKDHSWMLRDLTKSRIIAGSLTSFYEDVFK